MMNPKYLLRPITKRMDQNKLFAMLEQVLPALLWWSRKLSQISVIGKLSKRIIPVVDYRGVYPLSESQLKEWALLDTFDMLSPT